MNQFCLYISISCVINQGGISLHKYILDKKDDDIKYNVPRIVLLEEQACAQDTNKNTVDDDENDSTKT